MPGAQPLAALLRGVRLVVRADAGGGVGVQRRGRARPARGRRRARRARASRARAGAPLITPGKFIISASPITRRRRSSASRSPGVSARRGDSKLRRGHARRRHEVDVERQPGRRVEQPVHAVGAEHVRDLVRVGDDGRRPERQHEPRELVDEQLRRLEVHVRVDEARARPSARSRRASRGPRSRRGPAIQPSTIATSVSSHSRVKTDSTLPPRTTRSAGSSPRATARRRERGASIGARTVPFAAVEVLTPRTLDEALRLKSEHPDALADPGRHRRDGRAQLRPRAARGAAQPERGRRAARLVARERLAAARLRA